MLRKIILDILENSGPEGVYQGELVELTGYSKGWISETLDMLENEGLIRRIRVRGKVKKIVLSKYLSPNIGGYIRIGFVKSTEYIFLPEWIRKLKESGYNVETIIYSKVIDVVKNIATGNIHFGFAPIYTAAIYRKLEHPIRAIAGVALNGGRLFTRNSTSEISIVGTSELSTMETILGSYIYATNLNVSRIEYYKSPDDAINKFLNGHFRSIAIWEPYATILESNISGLNNVRFEDHIGDYQCCILIANKSLDTDHITAIIDLYIDSFKDLNSKISDLSEKYSRIIGIDRNTIIKSARSYIFKPYLDRENILSQLKNPPTLIIREPYMESIISEMII